MKARHLPQNIWGSPVIKQRLYAEACFEGSRGKPAKEHYWFCVPQIENGFSRSDFVLKNYMPGVLDIDPHEMQQQFVRELRYRLQINVAHDGVWIVGWTHPPASWEAVKVDEGDNCFNRLVMIWLDEEGDPQFTLESEEVFVEMIGRGGYYYLDLAEKAWSQWSEIYGKKVLKSDFMLKEEQITAPVLASLKGK